MEGLTKKGGYMKKVFIVAAKRTAIGSFLGSFKNVPAVTLGEKVIRAVLADAKIDSSLIDEVIMGNVLSADLGQGASRQASVNAGIPVDIPAYGVNMLCGSGMKAVLNGYASIQSGLADCIIAGGFESMSMAPFLVPASVRNGSKMGELVMKDHMLRDGLLDAFNNYHMGITAENIAEKHKISRAEQDAFAYNSQTKAIKSVDSGLFDAEIVPVEVASRKETITVSRDEYPNRTTNLEKLGALRPAFKKDGSVTAGNSSGINDGASAVVIVSEDFMKKHNLSPLVEVVAVGQGGVDPAVMGLGPVPAIRNALKQANMSLNDMEYIELNEAFAAQSLGVISELVEEHKVDRDALLAKTNIRGGAIALGHPIGASGNRILVTLINILKAQKADIGLASLCIGGGMGTAIIIKNIK